MRTTSLVRRIVALAVVASAAGLIGAAPSEAFPTEGFHVHDNSTLALRVLPSSSKSAFESRPPDGAVIRPGVGYHAWEEFFDRFRAYQGYVFYSIEGARGSILIVDMRVSKGRDPSRARLLALPVTG